MKPCMWFNIILLSSDHRTVFHFAAEREISFTVMLCEINAVIQCFWIMSHVSYFLRCNFLDGMVNCGHKQIFFKRALAELPDFPGHAGGTVALDCPGSSPRSSPWGVGL